MRIGIYINNFTLNPAIGGAFTHQYSLLTYLHTLHCKHTFYLFHYGECVFLEIKNTHLKLVRIDQKNITQQSLFKRIKNKFYNRQSFPQRSLQQAARNELIDMMWFTTNAYEPVDIPFIYTVFDLQHRRQPYFPEVSITGVTFDEREKYYHSILPRASYIITGNSIGKEEIKLFYGISEERIKCIEFPTPDFSSIKITTTINSLINKYNLPSSFILYPAQFWPHKNHVAILHAIKKIHSFYNADLNVVFIGSDKGNLKYIKSVVQALDLNDNVFFLGFVPTEELISLYKQAKALVYASFFGPNNIPPLEAFALGCPVIAADVPGAREQLQNAALFFDPTNYNELADQIIYLLKNQELIDIIIKRGYRRALMWTSKDYIQEVIKIIDEFETIRNCWSRQELYIHP